ncbi:MAG: hypothetical protein K6A30_03760 [Lachnospiraceae bacterium]|nr:hypothetical protein [Lachnospiraceae bacterium]
MRNRTIQRFLVSMLALSMTIGGFSIPSEAAKKQQQSQGKGTGHIAIEKEIGKSNHSNVQKYSARRGSYPSSYSLVDKGYVTPVRNQGENGTCWAFAAIASMESNLLVQGYGNTNLSEAQLVYFMFHNTNTETAGLEGDKVIFDPANVNGVQYYELGANNSFTMYLLAKGYGPVEETTVPYSMVSSSLSDEYANGKNAYAIDTVYEIDAKDTAAMKSAIMQYGAITKGVAASEERYFSQGEKTLYVNNNRVQLDHEITVVGWDDNYSRDNFGTVKPRKDGAWLCRNSWGTDWGENGYFWLSYEDVPSSDETNYSYVFTLEPKDSYDTIYQYDGGGAEGLLQAEGEANIFTADKDQLLNAVRIRNTYDGDKATITVYTGCTEKKPTSGIKVLSQSVTFQGAGYQTIDLTKDVLLTKGEKFSIVVTFSDETNLIYDMTDDYSWIKFQSTSEDGQSYYKEGSKWYSTGTEGNVRVKALAKDISDTSGITLDSTTVSGTISSGYPKISWSKVNGAQSYQIYRKSADSEAKLLTTVTSNSYTDKNVKIGTKYSYYVVSYKEGYQGGVSNTVSITARLKSPTYLKLSKSSGKVKLSWIKVSGAKKYYVYRKLKGGSYKKIATTGNVSTYTDRTVKAKKTYYYKLKAVNASGVTSAYSTAKYITAK